MGWQIIVQEYLIHEVQERIENKKGIQWENWVAQNLLFIHFASLFFFPFFYALSK